MNYLSLERFRAIAAALAAQPTNWQWIGQYDSQRHFGITEERAKDLQGKHGGEAKKMDTDR